jgi:surface carbohydrate biosynthesis protein
MSGKSPFEIPSRWTVARYLSMKTICFPIEVYQREIDTRLLLAIRVASRGARAVIGQRSDEVFKQISGATFFMSPPHANTSLKLVQKFEQADNTVCFHDEEGFIRQSDEVYLGQRVGETVRRHGKIHFTWNKSQDDLLKSIHVTNTCITGSPKFDLPLIMKEPLRDRFRVNINTRFGLANPAGEIGLEGVIELARGNNELSELDRERLIERYQKDTAVLSEFLDLIEKIGQDGSIPTAIRVHPAESQKVYREIAEKYDNIEVESGVPLFESINHTSVVVHDGCTTAFDAKLMDRRVVALRPEAVGAYYDDLANKFSDVCCTSAAEVFELLSKIEKSKDLDSILPSRKTMLDDLIPNSNGTLASDLIVDTLMKQSSENPSPSVSGMTNRATRLFKRSIKGAKRKIRSISGAKNGTARRLVTPHFATKYPSELDMEDLETRFEKLRHVEVLSGKRVTDLRLRKINNQVFEIIPT